MSEDVNPKQGLKDIVDRFGWEGLDDLTMLDQKTEVLLHRLYIVTSIGHNLYVIDEDMGRNFLKRFDHMIRQLEKDAADCAEQFTRKHGEM